MKVARSNLKQVNFLNQIAVLQENMLLKLFQKISSFLIVASTLTIPFSANAEEVLWGRTNFPPFTILTGPFAGQGVVDQMIDFYIDRLPQYDHEKIEASLTRVLILMKQGEPICHGSLLKKAEREAFAEFLIPNMVQFSNGILTSQKQLKSLRPHMTHANTINFKSLVHDKNLSIRFHANRSYSPYIDEIISNSQTTAETSLVEMSGMKDLPLDIKLILRGRIDGLIGRPAEAYFAAQSVDNADDLIFLPIDGQPKAQVAQIGCAKHAWGDQFIRDVNAITLKYRKSKTFKDFYLRWLPENIRDDYSGVLETSLPQE